MSINQKPQLTQSSYFKEEFTSTPELKALGLCCTLNNNLTVDVYMRTKTNILKKKKVYTSKKDTEYIKHQNHSYTLHTILDHTISGTPLYKGIDKAYTPRTRFIERRVKKVSLFARFLDWFEGKLS